MQHWAKEVPILLVGMKMDLLLDEATMNKLAERNRHAVTYEEAMQCAKEMGAVGFFPISSLTGDVSLSFLFIYLFLWSLISLFLELYKVV